MRRVVKQELLVGLPATDPRTLRARTDLRRVNFIMGNVGIRSRALRRHHDETDFRSRPLRLVELGGGDGAVLLPLARFCSARGVAGEVTLLDRHNLLSAETHHAFTALRWPVTSVATDVFTWLDQPAPAVDVMFATLFLHEFPEQSLGALLRLAALRTNLFIACEPRRSPLTLVGSHLLGLLGCSRLTRHDGILSAHTDFAATELSAHWPRVAGWELSEQPAGWFSHRSIAKRTVAARSGST